MCLLRLFVMLFVISTLTYAQRGGMRGGGIGFRGGSGFRSGFVGGGEFRGGFVSPGLRGNFGFVNRSFFFPRNRFFFPPNRFFFPRSRFGFGFGGFGGYPIGAYPYAYVPAYPYAYDYGYASAPASSPVVIEQNDSSDLPRGAAEANYYLIAFNDHIIRAAVSFWVEGDEIHWISREHEQKQAPLSSVDRRFSELINRDRHVEFKLP